MVADTRHRTDVRLDAGDVDGWRERFEFSRGRIDFAPPLARFELRMVPELLHRIQAGIGDARVLEASDDLRRTAAGKRGFDQCVKFGAVLVARAARGKSRVHGQPGLADHLRAKARELALVLDAEEDRLAVA